MNPTEEIVKSGLKLHMEAEFSSDSRGFQAFNDAGIEAETGEFLYGMVRLLKPLFVLETGTHEGVGASYMGLGLKANGYGTLHTLEFLEPHWQTAQQQIAKLGLQEYVNCFKEDVGKWETATVYDLILLDTEPQTRFAELIKFYPNLNPGGFLFIHDLHRHMHQIDNEEHGFGWPYGKLPQEIINMVKEDKLRPFHFNTPRGLTGFYKPNEADYQWISKK